MRANLAAIAKRANHDPKQALLKSAGPLTDYEVFHNLVLVATYMPGEKIGSIIIPDVSMAENRFQGKMGLVLKCGPLAFKDDDQARFGGIDVEVGDWVLYRPSDGIELFIKDYMGLQNDGLPCRLIEDSLIKGRVADPALIY
jgi:co-chaperonin GroES (HSP10)